MLQHVIIVIICQNSYNYNFNLGFLYKVSAHCLRLSVLILFHLNYYLPPVSQSITLAQDQHIRFTQCFSILRKNIYMTFSHIIYHILSLFNLTQLSLQFSKMLGNSLNCLIRRILHPGFPLVHSNFSLCKILIKNTLTKD